MDHHRSTSASIKEHGLPTPDMLTLGVTKMDPETRQQVLKSIQSHIKSRQSTFIGYQVNQNLELSKHMAPFLDIHMNNAGDPFTDGNVTTSTKFVERAVLDYYASLWNAKAPHEPSDGESYWGSCLTMGSTEGNFHALWNARDYLSGKVLLSSNARTVLRQCTLKAATSKQVPPSEVFNNAFTPVAFYSQDAHYSLPKAMRMLNIPTFSEIGNQRYPGQCPLAGQPGGLWPHEVPSKGGQFGPGSVDIPSLVKLVKFFAARGYPIIVCFNYGTTLKCAFDDVKLAGEQLMEVLKRYNLHERELHPAANFPAKSFKRNGYWFHVDGALGAAYMPFVEKGFKMGVITRKGPDFDFRLPFVSSIVTSDHKWVGNPVPCGVYMTKTKYHVSLPNRAELFGSPDTTFAGSRNGLSVLLQWYQLSKESHFDKVVKVVRQLRLAKLTEFRLRELEKEMKLDLHVARSVLALAVRFRRPNDCIVEKFSLPTYVVLSVDPESGEEEVRHYSHVYIMDHVNERLVDEFVLDLKRSGYRY